MIYTFLLRNFPLCCQKKHGNYSFLFLFFSPSNYEKFIHSFFLGPIVSILLFDFHCYQMLTFLFFYMIRGQTYRWLHRYIICCCFMNFLVRLIYYDCMLRIPMIHKIVPECQQTVFSPQILKNL